MDAVVGDESLTFFVNGKKIVVGKPDPETNLLYYLRTSLYLTGTKLACGEGGCGACTVMISRYDSINDRLLHYAVNACLVPLCSLHGLAVTTVEGIGGTISRLHPVQERLVAAHGIQCGFCTPGMVMSAYALLRSCPQPSADALEKALAGNLCRCTGYRPILEGFKTFTKEFQCPMGSNCCQVQKTGTVNGCAADCTQEAAANLLPSGASSTGLVSTQEPIFPPELKLSSAYRDRLVVFQGQQVSWYRPVSLGQLIDLKKRYPDAKLIAGNTQIGLDMKHGLVKPTELISVADVPELNVIKWSDAGVCIGSAVTMSRLRDELAAAVQSQPEFRTRSYAALIEALSWFAGQQVRNMATLGGHVMTASPIADVNPVLIAVGATAELLCSLDGKRRMVPIDETFFTGPSTTAVKPSEVLLTITVPFTGEFQFVYFYKQAPRKENSRSIVNAAMGVQFRPGSCMIDKATCVFGGLAPITLVTPRTAASLAGKEWAKSSLDAALAELRAELDACEHDEPSAGGGSRRYKTAVACGFLLKFYVQVYGQLDQVLMAAGLEAPAAKELSAALPLRIGQPSSIQVYEEVDPAQPASDLVGRPVTHRAAKSNVLGEAQYTDDVPSVANELFFAPVRSIKGCATIVSVDASTAIAMPGVVDYISHKDVPEGKNIATFTSLPDEFVFAVDEVLSYGQIIGAVIACTPDLAVKAAATVKVVYDERPAIVTIEDAIAKGSFFDPVEGETLERGDIEGGFCAADVVLNGQLSIGGQQHFYMEMPCTIVIPKENNEVEVVTGTQASHLTQRLVANLLSVPANRVVVRTKRIGGGFGGKEAKLIPNVLPVVVAANRLKRPVRYTVSREEEATASGGRHPYFAKYKVGLCRDGRLLALAVEVFGNAGRTLDCSPFVLYCVLKRIDNCYNLPNVKITGKLCKTNIPSNTAMRGFGGPQAMLIMEHILTEAADALGLSQTEVREKNFYKDGDLTPYKQVLKGCHILNCWEGCMQQSELSQRQIAVQAYNRENRWKKRGLAIVPTKFPLTMGPLYAHQAGALVQAYTDGSVIVHHGGIEMGQGLHTKIVQIATRALNIDENKIYIYETSTATVPNTIATGGSLSTDSNGMAVKAACEELLRRLQPFIAANPTGCWSDWVQAAYYTQVSLSATGFYKCELLDESDSHVYCTYGVACSEVEIDCLTGDHQILRTDIVMDVGRSLNPAIDIGQIEGAFMQGYGMMCLEEVKFTMAGYPLARGPNSYKIPSFGNIPLKFNVSLLKNIPHPTTVYGSKGIGEPPLFLAASVFFAIRAAIQAARAESGLTGSFPFDSPATPERIRLSCADQLTGSETP